MYIGNSPDPWVHGVSDNRLDAFLSLAPMPPLPLRPPIVTYGTYAFYAPSATRCPL